MGGGLAWPDCRRHTTLEQPRHLDPFPARLARPGIVPLVALSLLAFPFSFAILTGLDIDALRDVSKAVNGLKAQRPEMGTLMVTHYKVRRLCNCCGNAGGTGDSGSGS